MRLPPTSERIHDPKAIPYFLWDVGINVGRAKEILAGSDRDAKDEILVRLLREANTRDVWYFVGWNEIDEAWTRIAHRLGRSRAVWEMIRARREERDRERRAG